jgi:hypothetical protein
VVFPNQPCHFFAGLALANAAVVLNPEARRFRNDLIVRRKSHAGAHLIGLVRSSNQDSPMHDGNYAEKRCIYRDQSAGSIRKCLELFQGDIKHRPSSIKQLGFFAKRLIDAAAAVARMAIEVLLSL